MYQQAQAFTASVTERLREEFGRRATGFVLAIALELLLVLLLLTLSQSRKEEERPREVLSTFDASSSPEQAKAKPEAKPKEKQPSARPSPQPAQPDQSQPRPSPPQPAPPQPAPTASSLIPLTHDQMASADISNLPRSTAPPSASKPVYGPVDSGVPGDTARVGTAPNGQPLYAAAWYRKPYDSELAGYLSTAQGPGWGMIACKTAPDFRVDDCVALDEYPDHSNIARAVLAAAWQFKVRPPRIGGKSVIGAWVRIRIDYGIKTLKAN